jgi:hypothetical protein
VRWKWTRHCWKWLYYFSCLSSQQQLILTLDKAPSTLKCYLMSNSKQHHVVMIVIAQQQSLHYVVVQILWKSHAIQVVNCVFVKVQFHHSVVVWIIQTFAMNHVIGKEEIGKKTIKVMYVESYKLSYVFKFSKCILFSLKKLYFHKLFLILIFKFLLAKIISVQTIFFINYIHKFIIIYKNLYLFS